ncbi:MAG TPA: 3-phosphoshikimate 1-carboxyvinyltransferase [Candidatus Acidoferrales bacterium]|jgi:3-phosphoshikimate 1-carboxyvinyltransferase|nr:3-phosphoshikimate 1-carboxyvinyltransferase [Candidatus Acidoferrales bacterium]
MLGDATTFRPGPLRGELTVPGDKSISHRALIAGAALAAHGEMLRVSHLNPGRDVRATLESLLALGIRIERESDDAVVSGGRLRESTAPIDCMNSGSTARMLLGVCAGANVPATFDGDESLRRRPMEPVAAQLRAFGAKIETNGGRMPVRLSGTPAIETLNFILLTPSAQVKSALLFAGVFSGTAIKIAGDSHSRDHTERMLHALGWDVQWDGRTIALGARAPEARDRAIAVAGDFSSAAFFITAAALTPGSSLVVRDTGVNPTRTGLLDALRRMGARIELRNERVVCGEPVADVAVEYAPLHGIDVASDLVPRAIDEIPLLAVAAAFAAGTTRISGIGELRAKESDRIAAIERLLAAVGIATEPQPKGLSITGGTPISTGGVVETHDDHRTAMAAAVLACAAGPIAIDSERSIDVSFPSFLSTLESVRT